MIFRRKKPTATPGDGQAVMRGRDSAEDSSNPLARRFHQDDEPDTIDLQQPAGFNSEPETAEHVVSPARPAPTESPAGAAPTESPARPAPTGEKLGVISLDLETGKFYVQPGWGDCLTFLGDEPVRAPTELRHGDRIRVGDTELQLIGKRQE